MATMRVGPYTRLGPDLQTRWGTYPSPYITAPAADVARKWAPPTIRGRHKYRTQPRNMSMLVTDPVRNEGIQTALERGRASLVPTSPPYAHGVGADDPQVETKIGMYVFLGAVGLLSLNYLFSKGR